MIVCAKIKNSKEGEEKVGKMEKDKREKFSYAKLSEAAQLPVPNLIEIQQNSFSWFIKEGLLELMREIFPVADFTGNLSLEFLSYSLDKSVFTLDQCRDKDMHYAAPLRMKFRLINKNSGEIKEQEVLLGSFPLMTEMGTFIINGAERVVVSQLTRSPGIYFKETSLSGEERSYSAKIIPRRGSWVEFDLDPKGVIWIRMERARKLAATTFLRALGYSQNLDIFKLFGQKVKLTNPLTSSLLGRLVEEDLIDPISQVVIPCAGKVLDLDLAKRIEVARIKEMSAWEVPDCIRNTLEQDPTTNSSEAYLDVYKKLRPTEPPTKESAKSLINTLFFDLKHYDLGRVGRYKINQKFGKRTGPEDLVSQPLTKEDFLEVIKYLIKLSRGEGELDDIDHLGNRRVRSVGELLQNQFRVGLLRLVKIARERMMIQDKEIMTPQSLINIRPLVAAISGFFGSSQLSQFMDQTNPLAELTHKRRLSALGPGGLSRERAGFEVRDVHRTHYGRICPIETPEGPNIGLINSLASYARVSELGFIETPYRRVKKGKVSDEISYLTADVEDEYYIAQANTPLTKDGKFADEHVMARYKDLNLLIHSDKIEFMDVSPRQVVSVATALIPFLEHDDANRALMGSNMQRQSVPLLCTEVPLISTGIEAKVANDSGTVVKAKDSGLVKEVNSQEIVVENSKGLKEIYPLRKFARSNQGTCVNQKPLIREKQKVEKREIIADGPCTDGGELALGRNILVAFMPWEGYNFEDAILISERLVREDVYTSIHIEEYESEARDTKLGAEEITRDTPNVSEDMLKDLDEKGIIRVGAEVSTEDILVGKVTPKGETELTPEERLLRAIFGEKAREMRDTSLRVPPGGKGKVVEVKVFSREDGEELPPGVNQLVRVYVAQKRKISEGDKVSGRHGNKGVIAKIFPQEDLPYLPDGTPVDMVLNPLGVPSRMNIGQILETHLGWAAKTLGLQIITPVFDGAKEEEIESISGIADLVRKKEAKLYNQRDGKLVGNLVWEGGDKKKGMEDMSSAKIIAHLLQKSPIILYTPSQDCQLATLSYEKVDKEKIIESWVKGNFLQIAKVSREETSKYSLRKIKEILDNAHFRGIGKTILFDGRTGQPFSQEVTVGYIYMMKLAHLVDDKIHARSTGPYALVTQQPLGGKTQFGGQRLGEMEVWALEAYGAAYTLQELLTAKSDDVVGRVKTYESIVKGENILEAGIPESFKVLVKELQSLGIDVRLLSEEKKEVEIPEVEDIEEVDRELERELA